MKVGLRMPGSEGFRRVNNYLGRTFESCDSVTFYPEVRYRGVRVYPQHWDPESNEPLAMCHMPLNIDLAETKAERDALLEQLLAEGWEYSAWEGLARAVHVDDLEKIEGPPPEGPF